MRRGWVSDATYAEILALSQLLPGPASSQTAFMLGWQRGGFLGAVTATLTFTLPSAVVMIILAVLIGATPPENGVTGGLITGLKITAVAVVAHAVLGMARSLAPKGIKAGIAVVASVLTAALPFGAVAQMIAIVSGAAIGYFFRISTTASPTELPPLCAISSGSGILALTCFLLLLLSLPLLLE